jgi:hypothetical protein
MDAASLWNRRLIVQSSANPALNYLLYQTVNPPVPLGAVLLNQGMIPFWYPTPFNDTCNYDPNNVNSLVPFSRTMNFGSSYFMASWRDNTAAATMLRVFVGNTAGNIWDAFGACISFPPIPGFTFNEMIFEDTTTIGGIVVEEPSWTRLHSVRSKRADDTITAQTQAAQRGGVPTLGETTTVDKQGNV